MFAFKDPLYLTLLLLLLPLAWWLFFAMRRRRGTLSYSNVALARNAGTSWRQRAIVVLPVLRLLALALVILALARPQSSSKESTVVTEGIDIVLAMDVSSSMLSVDFEPANRLEAAKSVAREFIKSRVNDRLGLVVFAGESFTQCPLTLDYSVLLTLLEQVKVADEKWDGTAIGMGLVNAVNRLRESESKSKVIILLTDGSNNRGEVDPITATQIAQTYGIRIYTIGAGRRGTAPYPVQDPFRGTQFIPMEVDIDEELLQQIADATGGRYFRATDTEKLKAVYDEISELEKTKIEVQEFTRYEELFAYFLAVGLLGLLIEALLSHTVLRRLP